MNDSRPQVDLSRYDNSWYKPGNGFKRLLWYFCNLLVLRNRYQPFGFVRKFFLRLFGAKVGKGLVIKPGVNIKYPWFLEIGNHCWIGEGVWIDNLSRVTMGDHVCLSQGALLLTGNHNYKSKTFDLITTGISLDKGVWIGARATVTAGVQAGDHAVLTAGSIATSDLKPYGIYQGNPASMVKERIIAE